jgi:hypothetical protein
MPRVVRKGGRGLCDRAQQIAERKVRRNQLRRRTSHAIGLHYARVGVFAYPRGHLSNDQIRNYHTPDFLQAFIFSLQKSQKSRSIHLVFMPL